MLEHAFVCICTYTHTPFIVIECIVTATVCMCICVGGWAIIGWFFRVVWNIDVWNWTFRNGLFFSEFLWLLLSEGCDLMARSHWLSVRPNRDYHMCVYLRTNVMCRVLRVQSKIPPFVVSLPLCTCEGGFVQELFLWMWFSILWVRECLHVQFRLKMAVSNIRTEHTVMLYCICLSKVVFPCCCRSAFAMSPVEHANSSIIFAKRVLNSVSCEIDDIRFG